MSAASPLLRDAGSGAFARQPALHGSDGMSPVGVARPVAFDGLFGWFNPGLTRRGVILCGTLGFEQLSAYRAWRGLADEIAATGCACLRFDYPGEGDSADAQSGRVAHLVAAIRRAIRYLREDHGLEHIVLVGLRFGANLAALAAREGGVDRLILLAPFAHGRAYLREMTLQARTTLVWPGGVPLVSAPGTINVHGFILDQALIEDIGRIGDDPATTANVPDLLRIDRTAPKTSPSSAGVPGITIRQQHFARFDSLLSGEMNFKSVAEVVQTFSGLNRAVSEFASAGARFHLPRPGPEPRAGQIADGVWEEEPVFFGTGMFGIICRSKQPRAGMGSVLFLNSGSYVRSGPSRFTARMARALAAQGIPSLRFDLRGTGDSADRADSGTPFYKLDVLSDVAMAIDRLTSEHDGPVTLIGFCSGAYLAFHAACRDDRVSGAVLANLYCFDWPETLSYEATVGRPTIRTTGTYVRSLLHGNAWRRILKGEIAVVAIALGTIKRWLRALTKLLSGIPGRHGGKRRALDRVAGVRRRGGRFVFVYSADDPALSNITSELGLSVRQFERAVGSRIEIIAACDHNFSTPEAQDVIARLVLDLAAGERADPEKDRRL